MGAAMVHESPFSLRLDVCSFIGAYLCFTSSVPHAPCTECELLVQIKFGALIVFHHLKAH